MTALELFKKVQARLGDSPAVPFLDAVEAVSQAITRVLMDLKSDRLNKTDDDLVVAPGVTVDLPSVFRGFSCRPWSLEDRMFLDQVDDETRLSATSKNLLGYDLRGRKLSLVPAQDVERNLKVSFYAAPTPVTDMVDDLPFDGDFDFIFTDSVVGVSQKGIEILSDPAFQKYVERKVSDMTAKVVPIAPKRNGYFD